MGMISGIMVGFVVLLLSLSITFTLLSFNTNGTLLNPDYYRNQLLQNNMYDKISDEVVGTVTAQLIEQVPSGYKSMIEDRMKEELKKIFRAKVIQAKIEPLIENTLHYLTSKDDTIDLTVDLRDVKESIMTSAKKIARQEAMNTLTDEQRGMIWATYLNPGGCTTSAECIAYCADTAHFDECDFGQYIDQIQDNQFSSVGDSIPDSIDLASQMAQVNGGMTVEQVLSMPRFVLTIVTYLPWVGLFIMFGLMGAVMVLGLIRLNVHSIPRNIGIACVLSGITLVVLGMFGQMISPAIAGSVVQDVPQEMMKFVGDFIGGVFSGLMWPGIFTLALGIGLIIASFAMGKKRLLIV
ncbi:Uncharacterised protein [Candidatus Gugararchaeum adminiculabundum]|nr:Uncharacterised protein [Candidatus Gugararchaeum adminiculabundum]